MASKSFFCILVLVVLISAQADGSNNNNFNLAMASKSLSDKGYHAMSMIFDAFFKTHDLENGDLSSVTHGTKIDTLLLGHPLVVTTLQSDQYASLNGVKVTEWKLYNDGGLIIHGVDNFFDPGFQILIYPWFDVKNDIHTEVMSGFSWVIKESKDNWSLLFPMVVIGLGLFVGYIGRCKDMEDEYELIQQQEEVVYHVLDVKAI
ncbi:hypothetical protein FEM48_Zijuj01G0242900 [Ziziphus jujuba var. spinosa]|uniref:Uncharacterized protein n=1 Tax=Ziziphus jujuba var. spinosa TaxID=714518 RepID=A0A978W4E9_ZIZJJ|nr:hypothetical protein FEM48_Zijuj01G0242900 [Ziziphus jujuba var. spinosa]